jgi:hypothetical protein
MPASRIAPILVLTVVLGGGCARAGGGASGPSLSAAFSRCPVPMMWVSDDPRPIGIRIRNEEADTVAVFLDRCTGHVRVGDVGPGAVRTFRLKPPLIDYGSGLRFFVYPGMALERFYVESLPVDTARVLELTVSTVRTSQCESKVYVDGEAYAGTLRDLGLERVAGVHMEYERSGIGLSCPVIHVRTRPASP